MKIHQKYAVVMGTILIIVGIFVIALLMSHTTLQHVDLHDNPFYDEPELFVTNVIDGDTIEIIGGDRVRYIGIDTPEMNFEDGNHECFAQEALKRNRELVGENNVRLERDVSNRDDFDRLLRYVHVDEIFINEILVREGYARAVSYPPDTTYEDVLREAEQEARDEQRGLWTECE